jgi:hypothetical protein
MKEPKDYYIFTSFDFLPLSREELVIFTKELALKLVRNYKGHDISVMTDSKRGKIGMRQNIYSDNIADAMQIVLGRTYNALHDVSVDLGYDCVDLDYFMKNAKSTMDVHELKGES